MRFLKRDIAALKKLVLDAKDAYYNKNSFLRIKLSEYSPEVATALKLGKLNRSAVPVLPEEATVSKGMLEITDDRYDLIEKLIETNDASWQPISGAKPVGKVKTALPHPLPSLSKAYPGTGKIEDFARRNKGPWVVSDKLDGNALEVVYKKGSPPKAYTKTSATVGQDVSFLVPHLNIPQKLNSNLAVRFETILPKAVFDAKHSRASDAKGKTYKNARNMVSGVFNTKGIHKALPDIEVVAHEILGSRLKPSEQLARLKSLGFTVVPHIVVNRITDSVLESILAKRKAKSRHMIDGLVVVQDSPHSNNSADDPDHAIAFKVNGEDNSAETTVLGVEWNVSKHRLYKPRINFKPVELAGATVNWTTGKNARFIKTNGIGKGAVIRLTRSGEVIPEITAVLKKATPEFPKEAFKWTDSGADIMLEDNVEEHLGVATKRIAAFLKSGLGVEHIALATVQKCYEAGMTTIKSFLVAKPTTFLKIDGIKEVSANKFYTQIQNALKAANLANVAANSGFFGRNFGSKRVQAVMDKHDLFKLGAMPVSKIATAVKRITGFSDITAEQFAEGLPKFIKWVGTLPIKFAAATKIEVKSKTLAGHAVCFTRFRNPELEAAILRHGGSIASGVNAKTTDLLVKDKSSDSTKVSKAKELGIPIYTAAEFLKKYKNLLF